MCGAFSSSGHRVFGACERLARPDARRDRPSVPRHRHGEEVPGSFGKRK
jgi:hypothetical protein